MSAQIRALENPEVQQPNQKRQKVDVKTELPDDFPEYPTLMDLDPEYGEKVANWNRFLKETYGYESEPESNNNTSLTDSGESVFHEESFEEILQADDLEEEAQSEIQLKFAFGEITTENWKSAKQNRFVVYIFSRAIYVKNK